MTFPIYGKKWLLVWYGQILVCWDDYSKPPTSSQYVVAAMFDMSRPKSEHDFLIQFWGWDMEKIQKTQLDTAATIISIGIYIYIHIKIYLYLYICIHIHNTVYTVSLKPGVNLCPMGCSELLGTPPTTCSVSPSSRCVKLDAWCSLHFLVYIWWPCPLVYIACWLVGLSSYSPCKLPIFRSIS